jgi:hypothetical protein
MALELPISKHVAMVIYVNTIKEVSTIPGCYKLLATISEGDTDTNVSILVKPSNNQVMIINENLVNQPTNADHSNMVKKESITLVKQFIQHIQESVLP